MRLSIAFSVASRFSSPGSWPRISTSSSLGRAIPRLTVSAATVALARSSPLRPSRSTSCDSAGFNTRTEYGSTGGSWPYGGHGEQRSCHSVRGSSNRHQYSRQWRRSGAMRMLSIWRHYRSLGERVAADEPLSQAIRRLSAWSTNESAAAADGNRCIRCPVHSVARSNAEQRYRELPDGGRSTTLQTGDMWSTIASTSGTSYCDLRR